MTTNKCIYISTTALLTCGLLLTGCERPTPTAQSDGVGLTVASEDGTGDDFKVTQAVHTALMAEPRLQSADIEVKTRKGDVKLVGTVITQEQKDLAERLATSTAGVHAVNNELRVQQ